MIPPGLTLIIAHIPRKAESFSSLSRMLRREVHLKNISIKARIRNLDCCITAYSVNTERSLLTCFSNQIYCITCYWLKFLFLPLKYISLTFFISQIGCCFFLVFFFYRKFTSIPLFASPKTTYDRRKNMFALTKVL